MATGEFGGVLDDDEFIAATTTGEVIEIGDSVFAMPDWSTGQLEIKTYHCDPADGTITGIDYYQIIGSGNIIYYGQIFHISGQIFGVFYEEYNSGYYAKFTAFTMNADGNGGSVISTTTLSTGSSNRIHPDGEPVVHVTGTIYATAWYKLVPYGGGKRLIVSTWNIPDTGTSCTSVDSHDSGDLATTMSLDFQAVPGSDIYAVFMQNADITPRIRTYQIDGSGNISYVGSTDLYGSAADQNSGIRACHVSGYIWAVAIYIDDASAYRLLTIPIYGDGSFGSIIDTDDTIFGKKTVFEFFSVGDNVFVIACGGTAGTQVRSVSISDEGTIGSVIDTLSPAISGFSVWIRYVDGNYYTGSHITGAAKLAAFSIECETAEEPVGPDRIYIWLGDEDDPEQIEFTDPNTPGYNKILGARTEIGWDEELQEATAGIAELIGDNSDGDFSPENASGQFYGVLKLGATITVYEIYNGIRYDHFYGTIEKITPHAEHDNQYAYIQVGDGMNDFAELEINTVLRTNTDAGTIVDDVLDAAAWPAGDRDVDSGSDSLQLAWFHKIKALDALRICERIEGGRFYMSPTGIAVFEDRYVRILSAGLASQHDFEDTMVELAYEWSKRLVYNYVTVRGRRYYIGGIDLPGGYDMGTVDSQLIWSAHTGDTGAPYISANGSLTLWAEFGAPLQSYTSLVKGTHWNANTQPDKTGTDVSDNISVAETQYGQSIKMVFTNSGTQNAYLVEPDSPPNGAPSDRTVLVYGVIYGVEVMSITKEDTDSQDEYRKRGLEFDTPFKSNPNDIQAHADFMLGKYKDAVPRAISVKHIARTAWPDDTIRVQCLARHISDRITLKSTKLGVDQDYYINKVIQDYVFQEAGIVHETTWIVERCIGSAEGVFWLLGVTDFGELGEATRLCW